MKLCLNAIVKNEGARIERMLASVAPYINSWVIIDTGSTDDTKQKIVDFFKARGIAGEIRDVPFHDWSQARNAALAWARKLAFAYQPDYFLLCDADMELVVKDPIRFAEPRAGASYDMYQVAGSTHYQNRRLISVGATGQYRGVTHEYIDIPTAGLIDESVASFIDHADGANRPDKYKRDIRLLKKGLRDEPNNERYFFYLAQSYRDAGQFDKAARWFKRRVEAGGWDEEVWQAQVNYAGCLKELGNEAGYIREMLVAYNLRPARAESMYDLAKFYRLKGMNAPALAAAEAVAHLPLSKDALFVNNYVYEVGVRQEISISAFYVPGKRHLGYKTTSDLAMQPDPHWAVRNEARDNLYHYIEPLAKFCPSFKWRPIDFTPPESWAAMNPSVALHDSGLVCNVRCVNYHIDDEGRYMIRGTDGTANRENPINTRNFVLRLGADPFTLTHPPANEVFPPGNMPCEWPLVIGFEDMRLIARGGELWASSTVRQLHADGNCEQVITRLDDEGDRFVHVDMHRMLRTPRQTEKNWAPFIRHGKLRFMWRPCEVVDEDGNTIIKHDPGVAVDNVSGSSQLIPFRFGSLGITHEARFLPGKQTRYYIHRFAWYNDDLSKVKFSLPFCFHDKVIEFCGGMCWHPNGIDLVISYGYKDESARIATIKADEVETFICHVKNW